MPFVAIQGGLERGSALFGSTARLLRGALILLCHKHLRLFCPPQHVTPTMIHQRLQGNVADAGRATHQKVCRSRYAATLLRPQLTIFRPALSASPVRQVPEEPRIYWVKDSVQRHHNSG